MTEPGFVDSLHKVVVKKEIQTDDTLGNTHSNASNGHGTFTDAFKVHNAGKSELEETEVRRKIKNNNLIVCKQKDIENIVNIKKEIEDPGYGFKEVKCVDMDTFGTSETHNDKCISMGRTEGELDFSFKKEVENAAYNLQKEIEHIDRHKTNSNLEQQFKMPEKGIIQRNLPEVLSTGDNEVSRELCIDKGIDKIKKYNQVRLEASILFTIVSNFPNLKNSTVSDDISDINVSHLDKKDLELNQSEQLLLTDVYLKALNNTDSVTSTRQKLFKICSRAQEKINGRDLLISKYCTVRPVIIMPMQARNSHCSSKNAKKSSVFLVGKNQTNKRKRGNTYTLKGCLKRKMLENDNERDKHLLTSTNSSHKKSEVKSKLNNNESTTAGKNINEEMNLAKVSRQDDVKMTRISENGDDLSIVKICMAPTKTYNVEKQNKYVCRCGKSFEDRLQRNKHIKEDHWMPKEFTCEDCGQSYKKWRDFSKHECGDAKDTNGFACKICNRIFESEKYLKNHTNIGKKTCKDCDKVFCYYEDLSSHRKTHLKYPCKICLKKFYTKWSLTMHIRNIHYSFKCEICKKSFKNSTHLKIHVKNKHAVDFHCDICDKNFKGKSSYTRHITKVCETGVNGNTIAKLTTEELKTVDRHQDYIDMIDYDTSAGNEMNSRKDNFEKCEQVIPASEELSNVISESNDGVVSKGKEDMRMFRNELRSVQVRKTDDVLRPFSSESISPGTELPLAKGFESLKEVDVSKDKNKANEHKSSELYNSLENNIMADGKIKTILNTRNVTEETIFHSYEQGKRGGSNFAYDNENLVLSNTNNRDFNLPESSGAPGSQCDYEYTSRLIVSNALFKKRDEQHRLRWKRKTEVEREKVKKYLTSRIDSITSKLKINRKFKNHFKQRFIGMNCKLQNTSKTKQSLPKHAVDSSEEISSHVSNKNSFTKRNATKVNIEHPVESRKISRKGETVSKSNDVIAIESGRGSDNSNNSEWQDNSAYETGTKDASEMDRNEQNFGETFEEDDDVYGEEVVSYNDMEEHSINQRQETPEADADNKLFYGKKDENNLDKRITRSQTKIEIENDNDSKKLRVNLDLSQFKLKKMSVVLTDIFKMGKTNDDILASFFNKSGKEQNLDEWKEIPVNDGIKTDDKLNDAALSSFELDHDNGDNYISPSDEVKRIATIDEDELDVDELSSESESDEDSEGYEECTMEEVAAMYKCT